MMVVLKEFDNMVEGSSPIKFFFLFFLSFLLSQRCKYFFVIYMFAEKTCLNVLCTCKATSLSKMAKLIWRYSDDARAIYCKRVQDCKEEKNMFLKRLSFGSKECTEVLKLDCASFLGQTS